MDVGFIGLGAMGKGMATNLVKAGHTVRAWNRSRGPLEELARQGATPVTSPGEAFAADVVLSMLSDDDALRSVIGHEQVLDRAQQGLVFVNMATISVALARELSELFRVRGIGYVAAPVFGRPDAAAAGKLHIVVAGEVALVARVQPLLDALGQKCWPVGVEPYRANVVKLAGNFMIAAAIASMGEAAALTEGHGVRAADLFNMLTKTIFSAPIYTNYSAMIAEKRYHPPGFTLTLGLKDVRLALAAGESVHAPLPIASVLRDDFLDAIAHGQSDQDWSSVAEVSRRRAGLTP